MPDDTLDLVTAAQDDLDAIDASAAKSRTLRDDAVRAALRAGHSMRTVAAAARMTAAAVHKIAHAQ